PTAMAIKEVLAGVDVERGMRFPVQGAQSHELQLIPGASSLPVALLQVLQQRNALFELLQIHIHSAHRRRSQVMLAGCVADRIAKLVGGLRAEITKPQADAGPVGDTHVHGPKSRNGVDVGDTRASPGNRATQDADRGTAKEVWAATD